MTKHVLEEARPGTREINLAVAPNADFDAIVRTLKETLVVPELPGVRGCHPCLSGLDRLVIQNSILPTLR